MKRRVLILKDILIWMLLLTGISLPEFVLANCEGTGPCYCYGAVCTNTPPPENSSSPSNGGSAQEQIMMQGAAAAGAMVGSYLNKAIYGDPQEEAKAKAEEAQRANEQRLRDEAAALEAARRAEETKQYLIDNLKGVEPEQKLQLISTEDNASLQMVGSTPKEAATVSAPKSIFYNKGFSDASRCISQNAGSTCTGVTAEQQAPCEYDYHAGYDLGSKKQAAMLDEAYRKGMGVGMSGMKASGELEPEAQGDCRTQWIERYNQGYFKMSHK